jgi:hypothetical protein
VSALQRPLAPQAEVYAAPSYDQLQAAIVDVVATWTPTERQHEFLAANDDILLYGGAAGGGKSDALLIDVLGLGLETGPAIENPDYQALICRRTFPELRDLIDRSRFLYPAVDPGAVFDIAKSIWTFSSGAKVEFNYLRRESDVYQFQGRAFQYIAFDEITQYASDKPFMYLMSRLRIRGRATMRCLMRATCNPGGVGHDWVKKFWKIGDDGGPTQFFIELEHIDDAGVKTLIRKSVRFIPARLRDNKYLSSDTGYLSNLLMMSKMDQRGLLEGRWDVTDIPGQVLHDEIERLYRPGPGEPKRVCAVPIVRSLPVNTFWDLGRRDATGIWLHQQVGTENRFIAYYENNLKGMAHYLKWLTEWKNEYGVRFDTHYVPHDGVQVEMTSNTSRAQMLRDAKLGTVVVVPRVDNLHDGIECLRQAMDTYWFDEDRCEEGLTFLKRYRFEYNERLQRFEREPRHDDASTAADALRQHAQYFKPRRPVTDGDIARARARGHMPVKQSGYTS